MREFNSNYLKNLEPLPEIIVDEEGGQTRAKPAPTRSTEERVARAGFQGYVIGFILCLTFNMIIAGKTGLDLFWSMWTYTGLCLFAAACVIMYFGLRKTRVR